VAVVHVPIDDGDALSAERESPRRGQGDVIDETEAHGRPRSRVVPRGSWERQSASASSPESFDEGDGPACSAEGRGDGSFAVVRIRVEEAALARVAEEVFDVGRLVNQRELRGL